jgi:histidinol dehydrogenase
MKKFIINNISSQDSSQFESFINISNQINQKILEDVNTIIEQVKSQKEEAIIALTNRFDKQNAKTINDLIIDKKTINSIDKSIDKSLKLSLNHAKKRITDFHKKQLPKDFSMIDKTATKLQNIWKPIENIGIYVPGGIASYPSSVLMSAIPAIVAGVKNITLFTPAPNNIINPAIIYCAKICNINTIYKIGGAQAIASMAFGTKNILKVDKIVGPGNDYVAYAKKILYGQVGIDMIAGPTDVTIITDNYSNPLWIAIDALSQLEHGVDSKAFIICDNEDFANQILTHIHAQAQKLSRYHIIEKSLKNSAIFIIKDINESYKISNLIAPEHLQISVKNPNKILNKITNAGAIFIGEYTPEAIGDYIAGPSHTLPTSGNARFSSGLSVYDFLKRISVISCSKKSFSYIQKSASIIAESESLTAHKLSIDIRNYKNL